MSSGFDEDPHTYVHLTFQNTTRGTKTWPCPPHWIILEAYWYLKVYITHTHIHTQLCFQSCSGAWRKGRCFHFIFINHSYISPRPSFRKSAPRLYIEIPNVFSHPHHTRNPPACHSFPALSFDESDTFMRYFHWALILLYFWGFGSLIQLNRCFRLGMRVESNLKC